MQLPDTHIQQIVESVKANCDPTDTEAVVRHVVGLLGVVEIIQVPTYKTKGVEDNEN